MKHAYSNRPFAWAVSLIALLATRWALAQEPVVEPAPESAQERATGAPVVDPPGRVARLSLIDGDVSMAPSGTEEWADAVLNRPLTSGDRIGVGKDGRAELQVGSASIHLNRDTGFEFIELDDDVMQMSVTEGAATVRVRTLGEHETVQVETPNATIHLRHPGEYTFEVDPENDRTIVRSRGGEAEVGGGSKSFRVRAGEEGVFTGLDGLTAHMGPLPARTAFEAWANDRDRRSETSTSARYVAPEVIGYEDLDGQGEWISEPEYGYVWRPTYVVADWAPYRYGRWSWVRPWGWTWIDDAWWGFAPFHYGRWAFVRHRWCWVPPGRHFARPVYAPALVGWVGGPSVSVSVAFGHGVGWFPLAPHEVFVPWYRHTPRYVRHVNVSNTIIVNNTHITNIYNGRHAPPRQYHNRSLPDAVTAVQRDTFVAGSPVATRRIRVDSHELRQWRDDVRPTRVAPDRNAILAGETRRTPPPVARSFANDNPKRQVGDFRSRSRLSSEEIKRGAMTQRDMPQRDMAQRDTDRRDRVQRGDIQRGDVQRGQNRERTPQQEQDVRRSDHMERPPVHALQSTPAEQERRIQQQQPERRFEQQPERRFVQPERPIQQQREREVQEPRVRQWGGRESPPRQSEPVERPQRAEVERSAPPVEWSAPPVERSAPPPRVEHQNSDSGSNRSPSHDTRDNRASSRRNPNTQPD